MRKIFFIENNPNLYSKDPTELLGPLPYKRNEDYHHSHHHSLDAHKVGFKIYNDHLNSQIHFSMEFDCTVRNIKNLDFSIYVSFCVSHLERNIHLRGTALCAPSLSEKVLTCYYWTYQVSVALELPADLLSIVGLEWLGRRSKLPFLEYAKSFPGGPRLFPCLPLV